MTTMTVPEQAPTTVLVCATTGDAEPCVVLADGSYETEAERVFWRHTPEAEVLRLPLQVPVSVRPVRRFPAPRPAADGEQRLLAALAPHRAEIPSPTPAAEQAPTPAPEDPHAALKRRLAQTLAEGDHAAAEGLCGMLWHHLGLAGTHAALAACLDDAGGTWARGGGALQEHRVSASVRSVLERLRASSRTQTTSEPVVLAVPAGDRHTLALVALSHQLQEAGRSSLVVDDLPLDDLVGLLRERPLPAVVVSAHLPLTPSAVRGFVAAVREASPSTLVVLGGPGVPRGVRGPDLVTEDTDELLAALAGRNAVLSHREREVLLAVADGRTNNEIADDLGLSPATVKTHLDHVFAKTGTEHRAAAVARALRKGWIT